MRIPHYLIILVSAPFLFSFSFKENPEEKLSQRMQFLTNKTWKVYEVNVATFIYTDSISTGIEYKFSASGDCFISTPDGSGDNVLWTFDASQENIIFNEGTPDETIYKIVLLSDVNFSYKVIYEINGQNMEYTYKLKNKF